ncbi:unnamed protein product [Lymnaea stagnalis]|uniref:Importin subunit alpha n=1 Tax=Lymnaea stagnalis TaxID=6523 RepID=A0AAV2I3D0_LYMST
MLKMATNESNEVGHENLYKKSSGEISHIKFASKAALKSSQLKQRERLITHKRLKIESLEKADLVLSSQEEREKVVNATRLLKHGKKAEALRILHRSFSRHFENAQTFISCEGLPLLHSCFLSADSEILHAAAWCAINLSAGSCDVTQRIMSLSPTLIQFLQGNDAVMQELCAWAIANLAGDSQINKRTLLEQGCIPYLVDLISVKHQRDLEARSQSVLFALINLARDTDYTCLRCMQEGAIYPHVVAVLKETPPTSDICYEIGWLVNCIYARPETFAEYKSQFIPVLSLVISKLSQIVQLIDQAQREKVILPYIYCIGNIIGQSSDMAAVASQHISLSTSILACLTSETGFVQKEILWMLQNFFAEPSCRVLVMCQPQLLQIIFNLCHSFDFDIAFKSLCLVDDMTKVSCQMCEYLLHQGFINMAVVLLKQLDVRIVYSTLDILMDVVSQVPEATVLLATAGAADLQQLLSTGSTPSDIRAKAQQLLSSIQLVT